MKLTTLGCCGIPYKDGGTTSYLVTSEDGFHCLWIVEAALSQNSRRKSVHLIWMQVIISHYHPDHIADLGVLRHYFQLYPNTFGHRSFADLWS